jgi:hypothetical protein
METTKPAYSAAFSFLPHPGAAQMLLAAVLITAIFLVLAHINRLIIEKTVGDDPDDNKPEE